MTTTRDLRGLQVRGAIGKIQEHLFRNLQDGRYRAGCEGRALETAMGLHLFDSLNFAQEQQARLARYCEEYINDCTRTPLDTMRGNAGYFNRVVSVAAARGALNGLCPASGLQRFNAALTGYVHHSSGRKTAVLRALLAELGLVPPADEMVPIESARLGTQQGWVRAGLTAVRILQACHLEKLDLIGDEEVSFLLDAQSADGSWDQHILISLGALLALSKVRRRNEAVAAGIAAGLEFVLRQIRDDGSLPFIPNEDNWVTCVAGHALLESGVDPASLAHVARYLQEQQQSDGGWAYAPGVKQTDSDDTCVSLMFLAGQDAIGNRDAIERATHYLLDIQNPDGGFPTFVRGAASEAEITAKAIQALVLHGDVHAEAIRRGWAWLAANQAEDGSFREEWNLSKTFPIMHVLGAAAACGPALPEVPQIKRRCVTYLMGLRRADGWWPMQPDAEQPHLLSTAYAVAGLAQGGETQLRRELDASSMLMIWQQRPDGGFDAAADSLGPRPLVYDVRPLATIYCLRALSALAPMHPMEWIAMKSVRPPPLGSMRLPSMFPPGSTRLPSLFPPGSVRLPSLFPPGSARLPSLPPLESIPPASLLPMESIPPPAPLPMESTRPPSPSLFPMESTRPPAQLTSGTTRPPAQLTSGSMRPPEPVAPASTRPSEQVAPQSTRLPELVV